MKKSGNSLSRTPVIEERDEFDAGADSSGIDSPVLSGDIISFAASESPYSLPKCKPYLVHVHVCRLILLLHFLSIYWPYVM